ncbi:MAG: terminase family protein, partial [Actinobacteria bacterium]|nr:terminase family protein [Actinomycetota bacterium]
MSVSAWELAARLFEAAPRPHSTPGDLARSIDTRVRQTPALDLIDAALVDAYDTPDGRLVISMPPQEGKSQRASRWFPLWVLEQNPDTRIGVVSYELGAARRLSRAVRDDIVMNPHLGLRIRDDLAAQHEWGLEGHDGGIYAAGIGGALTGRPIDLLIVDDPFKDRVEAESATYRQRAWDWWTDVGAPRLAPGATV